LAGRSGGRLFAYTIPDHQPALAGRLSGNSLTLTWTNGVLQTATNVPSPCVDVTGAVSPHVITNLASPQQFFRVRGD
jgi:hypothetical protein